MDNHRSHTSPREDELAALLAQWGRGVSRQLLAEAEGLRRAGPAAPGELDRACLRLIRTAPAREPGKRPLSPNTRRRMGRLLLAAVVAAALLSTFTVARTLKAKNIFQAAADQGVDISQVDVDGDLAHTSLPPQQSQDPLPAQSQPVTAADIHYDDPKVDIYHKMLNTIDFFHQLDATVETSMLADSVTTLHIQTDLDAAQAHQTVLVDGEVLVETYARDGVLTQVDHQDQTYYPNYGRVYTRADTPYLPLDQRITTEEDGMPCYSYRRNITNCDLASYAILPQELTFSYLKDFHRWEIADEDVTWLGRDCLRLEGTPTPYSGDKHGGDHFTMVVDKATGILMEFSVQRQGQVVSHTAVTSFSLELPSGIGAFDPADYPGYTRHPWAAGA